MKLKKIISLASVCALLITLFNCVTAFAADEYVIFSQKSATDNQIVIEMLPGSAIIGKNIQQLTVQLSTADIYTKVSSCTVAKEGAFSSATVGYNTNSYYANLGFTSVDGITVTSGDKIGTITINFSEKIPANMTLPTKKLQFKLDGQTYSTSTSAKNAILIEQGSYTYIAPVSDPKAEIAADGKVTFENLETSTIGNDKQLVLKNTNIEGSTLKNTDKIKITYNGTDSKISDKTIFELLGIEATSGATATGKDIRIGVKADSTLDASLFAFDIVE